MFKFDLCLLSPFLPTIQIPVCIKYNRFKYTQIRFDKIKAYGVNDHVSLSRKTEQVWHIQGETIHSIQTFMFGVNIGL